MISVAWWTCALLALAESRIYERCELASDLKSLGVEQDHIATWVCIAYHESRFDTTANNPYSGDHGLFQISELYWCGIGKACGLPCSVLRDDDISDDLKCALQVHEEHTRLQGDGFLAWVVYPQHCKHNTKKYLVDCDHRLKNATVSQSRSFKPHNNYFRTNVNYVNYPHIDELLPPYLTISSIFRGNYGKVLDLGKKNGVDWFNYKLDNVDELKLPVFDKKPSGDTTPVTTTTSSTTTTFVPPVMPWRRIETNQFRKKMLLLDKTTSRPTTKKDYAFAFDKFTLRSTTYDPPTEETTKHKSLIVTTSNELSKVKTATNMYKSLIFTSTMKPQNLTISTQKLFTSTSSYKPLTTLTSTFRPPIIFTTHKSSSLSSNAYRLPTIKTSTYKTPSFSTSTYKFPLFKSATLKQPTISTTITSLPSSTTTVPFTSTMKTTTTSLPTTKYLPWYTLTNRFASTTTKPSRFPRISTAKSTTSTKLANLSSTKVHTTETLTRRPQTKTTLSIFDLYLNPTKRPKLSTYRFGPTSDSSFKLKIFSGGTTTPMPPKNTTRDSKSLVGSEIKRFKRQTLLDSPELL